MMAARKLIGNSTKNAPLLLHPLAAKVKNSRVGTFLSVDDVGHLGGQQRVAAVAPGGVIEVDDVKGRLHREMVGLLAQRMVGDAD